MNAIDKNDELASAVAYLASTTCNLSDSDLSQPFRWRAHQEGVRFALLGAMHELRELAVTLSAERRLAALPVSRAQHSLAQYHLAYRDLAALLNGITDEEYERIPAVGEWPLRYVYGHIVGVERNFFALVHYGWRRQSESDLPPKLPEGEADRLIGLHSEFVSLMDTGSRSDLAAYHASIHDRALAEFAAIPDDEIDGPSIWWEGEPYPLEYRIHRMDAHLRQHTVQVEKTLDLIGHAPSEARRLLRQVYGALAEAEGVLIGAPDLGSIARATASSSIRNMADAAVTAVSRASAFVTAVTSGDREGIANLLEEDSLLVNALSQDGVPVVRLATYYGQEAVAEKLLDTPGIELEIWDGAALGRLETVKGIHAGWGDFILNEYSRDGFTPLQLACYFGRENVAAYLVEKGAQIESVSRNPMSIQPLHAAVAGDHTTIVHLLLKAGADPNAAQQHGFRPIHAAAQNANGDIIRMLLDFGANRELTDDKDRRAVDLVDVEAHPELIAMLLE